MNKELKYSLKVTLPILFSYYFISMAFGFLMIQSGQNMLTAWLTSKVIYTGAFQFIFAGFLKNDVSVLIIITTALFMNSRHIFYGLTFLKEFKTMGKWYPYMIFSLTDETYSLYCSLHYPENLNKSMIMRQIAVLCRIYWLSGTITGCIVGTFISIDVKGVDFCLTALFITILVDYLKQRNNRTIISISIMVSVILLLFLGAEYFILPAMLVLIAIILLFYEKESKKS